MDQWGNVCGDLQRTGSNASLNLPPAGMYPVPMWMNPMGTWHGASPSMGMFPFGMGMPGMPGTPSATRLESHSRSNSRAASPSPSIKSRKSQTSRANHRKYRDEDSDEEMERRSVFSYADRSERKSVRDRAERIRQKKEASSNTPRQQTENRNDDKLERLSVRSKQKNLSSESDDYKSDSHKESETVDESDEKDLLKIPDIIEEDSQPPAVPEEQWECEHCTFVNEAGTRVCSICCKTPTVKVKTLAKPSTKVSSGTNTQTKGIRVKTDVERSSNKLEELKLDKPVLNNINRAYEGINDKLNGPESPKKGRTIRKITFWPGTKFAPFYK